MDRERIPRLRRWVLRALGSAGVALMLGPAAAGAANITPTPAFFADDFTDNAVCSLREAIEVANDDGAAQEDACAIDGPLGADTVRLQAGGPYVLDIAGPADDTNASGDLDADTAGGSLTIEGAGAADTTIYTEDDPNWDDRVLHRASPANLLTVRDLTLSGGRSVAAGGGILSVGALTVDGARVISNSAEQIGGGIFALGPLTIEDSLIHINTVSSFGGDVFGGGVAAAGSPTTITSSIVRENYLHSATRGPEDPIAFGGGIYLAPVDGATATVSGSVIADNNALAAGAAGGVALGSGIHIALDGGGAPETVTLSGSTLPENGTSVPNTDAGGGLFASGGADGTLDVVNSTVDGNHAGEGGGLASTGATVNVVHSTFSWNEAGGATALFKGPDGTLNVRGSAIVTAALSEACGGMINSQGGNVVSSTPCLTGGPGNDEEGVSPELDELAANGGPSAGPPGFAEPILTRLPAPSSTVVDHIPAADCDDEFGNPLTLDQRGLPRPVDNDGDSVAECEAGSLELAAPVTVPPPATTPPAGADEDPACDRLRKKLRRAKKRGQLKHVKKLRGKLRRRDC